MEELFNKEYIQSILKPFEGKELRMRTEIEGKSFSIPFFLETSIESTFQISLDNMGIKFLLKDNYYIKRDLKEVLHGALRSMDLYTMSLDKLSKDGNQGEETIYKGIVKYMEENFNPQIAFTYYNMVTSLKVDEYGFNLNGVNFKVYK